MPGGVTKVIVIHEDFQSQTATSTGLQGGGWTWILSNLKTLLETGEPMPQGYSICVGIPEAMRLAAEMPHSAARDENSTSPQYYAARFPPQVTMRQSLR